MKFIATIFIVLATSLQSYALFVSISLSPWQGWDVAWRTTNDVWKDANASSLLAETQNLVKTYNKTKDITGTIVSTLKDSKSFAENIFSDATSLSAISRAQQNSLNEFFTWNATLKGEDGNSMLMLHDFYVSSTAEFRDEDGNLSIYGSINNVYLNDAARLKKMRLFYAFNRQMNFANRLYLDNAFNKKMMLAKETDFEAYGLMVVLNAEIFRRNVASLKADIKAIGNAESYLNEKRSKGQEFAGTLTEFEISQLQADLLEKQNTASQYRSEAFQIFRKLQRLEYLEYNNYELEYIRQKASNY